jgi:hypothetical protein
LACRVNWAAYIAVLSRTIVALVGLAGFEPATFGPPASLRPYQQSRGSTSQSGDPQLSRRRGGLDHTVTDRLDDFALAIR